MQSQKISVKDIVNGNLPLRSFSSQYFSWSNNRDEIECARMERLELIHKIATKTWRDYLRRPPKCAEETWANISERFTVVNLQTPVLETITSASHGGMIKRLIKKAYDVPALERAMKESNYSSVISEVSVPQSALYGTSYVRAGWLSGRFNLTILPSVPTEIITSDDHINETLAIIAPYQNMDRIFTSDGSVYSRRHGESAVRVDPPFGFIPVSIFRGKQLDPCVVYGDDLVWPATNETRQCTYLNNDIMVLEKMQSYSTLVIKGNEGSSTGQANQFGPFAHIRLQPGSDNDAKYISPQAAIVDLDRLMTSKFERCATQCQVPVEIFTRAKAGTNQSAGSSYLTHKPLYDLVVSIQQRKIREEHELLSIMSAMIEWSQNGNRPVDINKHRDALEFDIYYDRESNPSMNQSEIQTLVQAVDANLITHSKAYYTINKDGTPEEQAHLQKLMDDRMVSRISETSYDGFSSTEVDTVPLKSD